MRASSFVMIFSNLVRRFVCCSKRTDIKETHELPSRPEQSSLILSIPSHSPQHHTEPSPRLLDSIDGLEEYDSEFSMPPKRKTTDTAAAMDSPVKKARPTKKAKAAPEAKEGKPTFSSFHSWLYQSPVLGRCMSRCRASLSPRP